MLRRDRQIRTVIHQLLDATLFAIAFGVAYALRANPDVIAWLKLEPASPFANFAWLYLVLIPASPLVLESQGFYDHLPLCSRRAILWPLFKGCVLITVGLMLTVYVFHLIVARGIFILFGCIGFCMVYSKEELIRLLLKSKLAQLQYKRRFILVGTEREIARMRKELKDQTDQSVEIVADLNLLETPVQQIVSMLHHYSVYGVILSAKHTYFEQVEYVIRACELEGVEVWLIADFFATQISRTSFDELLDRPLLVFRTTPEASWQSVIKHVMDLVGAFILLIVLSPLFLLIAIAIKLTTPGPVFFQQQRSGQNGAPFTLYKFRTMITNAEQLKHELEALNEMSGPVFKVTNDPRITRIGKWLRRYSLDELPQLFNVLRGEMSLVGPRPLPVDEVKRFSDLAHRRRLSVKPGITCLWQISGRNQIKDFKDWVRLNLEYIDNWSLWLDLSILLRTIPAVFAATGAR
ncbi:MAG TPA: sugar transferase [Candidatus Limnocylindrales bacterium]|nr:sugar transferase [Candidatus Limnocylindrales bacterium]